VKRGEFFRRGACRAAVREQTKLPSPRTVTELAGSNAQSEQFNRTDTDHEHCERYGIVVQPIPLGLHDTPPGSRIISRTGRQIGSNARRNFHKALKPLMNRVRAPTKP
jgi:hypothetical protein